MSTDQVVFLSVVGMVAAYGLLCWASGGCS
jgi:hypothetical protein